jgi:hypothetical protein
MFAGTSDGLFWRKLQGQTTWEEIDTGFDPRFITDITSSEDNPEVLYLSMGEYKNGDSTPYLLRSKDAGDTWEDASGDLPQLAINSVLTIPGTGDSVIIVGTDAGVYASNNKGLSYHRLGVGMINVAVFDLEYDPDNQRLIAGTFGQSVLSYPLRRLIEGRNMTSDTQESAFAKTSQTLTVYPNPASTEICLDLKPTLDDFALRAQLTDLSGKLLASWRVGDMLIAETNTCLPLKQNINSGQYLLSFTNQQGVQSGLVTIQD